MLSLPMLATVAAGVVVTSFLSGIFGMAGGMILMGLLLALMPLPAAMVLHGVTQLTSNGWRAWLWRAHIDWRIVGRFAVGRCWRRSRLRPWRSSPARAWP